LSIDQIQKCLWAKEATFQQTLNQLWALIDLIENWTKIPVPELFLMLKTCAVNGVWPWVGKSEENSSFLVTMHVILVWTLGKKCAIL